MTQDERQTIREGVEVIRLAFESLDEAAQWDDRLDAAAEALPRIIVILDAESAPHETAKDARDLVYRLEEARREHHDKKDNLFINYSEEQEYISKAAADIERFATHREHMAGVRANNAERREEALKARLAERAQSLSADNLKLAYTAGWGDGYNAGGVEDDWIDEGFLSWFPTMSTEEMK
jgi:hypothetical protein